MPKVSRRRSRAHRRTPEHRCALVDPTTGRQCRRKAVREGYCAPCWRS